MSNRDPFGNDFDKRFDDMWDRHDKIFERADKAFDHPVRTFLIAAGIWLVGFIIVVAVIAFFVSLFI
jgi:hypothetical protein